MFDKSDRKPIFTAKLIILLLFLGTALMLSCTTVLSEECETNTIEGQIVDIITPKDGDTVSGAVEIIAKVPSCNCIGTTKLFVDGKMYEEGHRFDMIGADEMYVHYFNSNLYDNGEYELTVEGKHDTHRTTIKVTVNNTASTVKYPSSPFFVYPFNNSQVQGKVSITLMKQMCNCTYGPTISVDGGEAVELSGGSGLLICGYNYGRYNYELDTTKLSDGKHIITAGHVNDKSDLVLIVDNTGYAGDDALAVNAQIDHLVADWH